MRFIFYTEYTDRADKAQKVSPTLDGYSVVSLPAPRNSVVFSMPSVRFIFQTENHISSLFSEVPVSLFSICIVAVCGVRKKLKFIK